MKKLWNQLWNGEPVALAGYLTAGWTALAAFDAGSESFNMPVPVYALAAVVIALATRLVRSKVTPTDKQ